MKLKQLEVTNENIGVLLMSDDVYLIRFKEENKVKLNFIKGHKDVSILPPKLSFYCSWSCFYYRYRSISRYYA